MVGDGAKLTRHWLGSLSSAIPSLVLSARAFQLWIAPSTMEPRWFPFAGGLYLVEFVAIHATVATASVLEKKSFRRWMGLLIMVAGYLGLGWAFAFALGSRELFGYVALLILGRAVAGSTASREESNEVLGRLWVHGALFMALAGPTFSGAWPRLGLTPEVVAASHSSLEIGLHGMVGGSAIYFGLVGLVDLLGFGWLGGRQLRRRLREKV